jgi:enoyl-[acyl-carrier protein] reductase II
MFEGDLIEGELEIGQVASMIKESRPVAELFSDLLKEYELAKSSLISF